MAVLEVLGLAHAVTGGRIALKKGKLFTKDGTGESTPHLAACMCCVGRGGPSSW